MFSVRSENILLNYFVVLFTIGLLALYSFFYKEDLAFLAPAILFLGLLCLGLFLYFDRYFFFKMSFLLIILTAIFWLILSPSINLMITLILFLALSQINLILSYFALFLFLFMRFEAFEIYLIFSVFIFSLIFTLFFSFRNLHKNLNLKLFSSEGRHSLLRHNIGNLCSILFFKNKDKSLSPLLEEMRIQLQSEISSSKESRSSIAGLLRITVYLLNYDYNLKLKGNFFIMGDNLLWVCFFYYILQNYSKKGATILVVGNKIFIPLGAIKRGDLKKFLLGYFVGKNFRLNKDVLEIAYGR